MIINKENITNNVYEMFYRRAHKTEKIIVEVK